MNDRDIRGRFGKGNQAAAKRKRRKKRTTADLIRAVNRQLTDHESVDRLCAQAASKLLQNAANGDARAAIWCLDRFYPASGEAVGLSNELPSPAKHPLEFLDALALSVSNAELSTAQAARMSQLARPLIVDEAIRELAAQFNELQTAVDSLEHDRMQAVQ